MNCKTKFASSVWTLDLPAPFPAMHATFISATCSLKQTFRKHQAINYTKIISFIKAWWSLASFTIFKAIKEQITNIWLTNDQLWKIIWFRKLYERKKMDHLSQTNNGHCLRIQYLILSFTLGNLKWFLNHITFRKKKKQSYKGELGGCERRRNQM